MQLRNHLLNPHFRERRKHRVSEWQQHLETRIERLLREMKASGEIDGFMYHPLGSKEAREGKTFTVYANRGGLLIVEYFGVAVMSDHWHRSQRRHDAVPQWWIPSEMKDSSVREKILSLFSR